MISLAVPLVILLGAVAQDKWTPVADGVLDPEGVTLYLPAREGGIDMLDAVTGRLRYHFDPSGKPVALIGKKLVIESFDPKRANVVHIRVLSVPEGNVLVESKPLELPDWASTRPGLGKIFAARATIEKGKLLYEWEAFSSRVSGVPLPTEELEKSRKNAAGTARIDVETGETTVEAASPGSRVQKISSGPPSSVRVNRRLYTVVEDHSKNGAGRGGTVTRVLKVTSPIYGEESWEWPLPSRTEPALPQ